MIPSRQFVSNTQTTCTTHLDTVKQLREELIAAWHKFLPGSTNYPLQEHLDAVIYYMEKNTK